MAVGEETQAQIMNWTKNHNGAIIGGSGGGLCRPPTRLGSEVDEYGKPMNTSSSVVLDEINRINSRIECLDEYLGVLGKMIAPVLCAPVTAPRDQQEKCGQEISAPMQEILIKIRTRIERAAEMVQNYTERCAL